MEATLFTQPAPAPELVLPGRIVLRPYHQRAIAAARKALATDRSTLVVSPTGSGKAQPLDAKVLTPNGFVPMGEIFPGSVVCTPDGKTAKVLAVYTRGVKNVYRITCTDGASTRSCLAQLWQAHRKYENHQCQPRNMRHLACSAG